MGIIVKVDNVVGVFIFYSFFVFWMLIRVLRESVRILEY
jgi:hypothetical protein